jgi:multidrug efflux pump subunit AcrB
MMVLLVGGVLSLMTLRQERMPNTEPNSISVSVPFLGATPEEVEEGVCVRVEEALEGTEGINKMTSTASEGSCSVNLELETNADSMRALNDIKSKVDAINTFPDLTERPIVSLATVSNLASDIIITGNTDERTLKTIAEQVRDELSAMDGISQVSAEYVRPDEISVEVSETTLRRFGLTLDQVASAIRLSSLDLPGGAIKAGSGEILVRTQGQNYSGTEFEDIVVVTRSDGTTLRLGDIASVVDGFEEGDLLVRFNGQPAAMVRVRQVGNEDTIEIANAVEQYLEDLRPQLPDGIEAMVWRDTAAELDATFGVLLSTALGGLAMVLLVLALPLRFRLAMWVAAGIPIALAGAIMTFTVFDVTMNSLTVMGFILVLGLVVDDAIVVGERIYAHERHAEDQRTAAVNGADEVAIPVIFGVLTTVAAFMPIIFIPGRMGSLFFVIGFVVCIALAFSIIESMLILPSHLAHRARARDRKHGPLVTRWLRFQNSLAEGLENFAEHRYGDTLRAVLPWRYTLLAAGAGVLIVIAGLWASGRIVYQFFPGVGGNEVTASLTMQEGIAIEETARAAERIERAAAEVKAELEAENPDIPSIIEFSLTSIGRSTGNAFGSSSGSSPASSHVAEVKLSLVPSTERNGITSTEINQRLREKVGQIPDAVELSFSADAFNAGSPVSIELRGRNVEQLREVAALVRAELAGFDGVFDISDSFRSGKQEAKLSLLPEARVLGLTLDDLASQVRQAFYGAEAQRVPRGDEDVRVMVRYPEQERASLGDLEDMRIRATDGREVPFSSVAAVQYGNGYSSIRRVDRQRVVTVTADIDRSVTTPEEVLGAMDAGILPSILENYRGVSYVFSGEQEERAESMGSLFGLIPLALLVIYSILAIPLKSYLQPFVIMSVIPFGIIGAIVGHLVMGMPLQVFSILGMLALSGVVINSSLVLVDYINRQRRQGMDVVEAVTRAGIVRFRPILLTSITTFVGLMPLMLTKSSETIWFTPMAVSLGWGVMFATVITLFLVPCLYLALEDLHVWRAPEPTPEIVPSTFAD